nr:Fe-S cluster assembly protein SufB [Saprospiraceae bacterium]
MSDSMQTLEQHTQSDYKYGFTSEIDTETLPKGLNEEVVRQISAKKNEPAFLTEWRLEAFRKWQQMTEPHWPKVTYPAIDYQDIIYYAAPKKKPVLNSLDEADPEL